MNNKSQRLSIASKTFDIAIKLKNSLFSQKASVAQKSLQQIKNSSEQISKLRLQLEKQEQIIFILKGYFGKIEKIIYNKQSNIFEDSPIIYEKVQLHIREMLRRLSDIHNQKLNSIPVIYRKNNIKIYKHVVQRNEK